MRHDWKRLLGAGIGLCLLLTSCLGREAASGGPGGEENFGNANYGTASMGRYREEELALPEVSVTSFAETGPGEYLLFGYGAGSEGPELWSSRDGGLSWQRENPGWLSGWERYGCYAYESGGAAYVYEITGSYEQDNYESHLYRVEGDELTPFAVTGLIRGLRLSDSGYLLAEAADELEQYDLESGALIRSYPLTVGYGSGKSPGAYLTFGSTLAAVGEDRASILLFDLETGEQTGDIACEAELQQGRVLAVEPGHSALYYLDQGGLFRVTMDGGITEQVIDGRLASFGDPSFQSEQLFIHGDSFLVRSTDGLYRYVFDESLPTAPAQILTVYTLEEEMSVRGAASALMKQNPDVLVDIQVGVAQGSAVSAADALRGLATQLLAGSGPDVLVLDGLPVADYRRQGVLLDLVPLMAEFGERDALLANITEAYRDEEGWPAVPTHFSVAVLGGEDIGEVNGIGDLVSWLEDQETQRMGDMRGEALSWFYDLASPRWFGGDGELNAGALGEDLAAIKRYADIQEEDAALPGTPPPGNLMNAQASRWGGGAIAAMMGKIDSLFGMAELLSGYSIREGDLRPFPAEDGGVFLPMAVLGINAAGAKTELAREFLFTALSTEAQSLDAGFGLPVNTSGLENVFQSVEPGSIQVKVNNVDPETGEAFPMEVRWFSAESWQRTLELLRFPSTPSHSDRVLRELILEEGEDYIKGTASLEDTVDAIGQKVNRYLQEKDS